MLARLSIVAAVVVGCGNTVPPKQAVFVPPPCVNAPHEDKPVFPAPPHESVCFKKARPKAVVLEKKEEYEWCNGIDGAEMARVEARIHKDFAIHRKPSKLVIDFDCDRISSGTVPEVVLEDGSGHGGTLRIIRFRRAAMHADVKMIAYSHYYGKGVEISTSTMPVADFDSIVAASRVAVLAKPHLVPLMQPGVIHGMSGTSSSNDFHLGLRFSDDENHTIERHFTGYEGSSRQEAILPMRMATERFETTLASLAFTKEPAVADDDRDLFVHRFLAAMRDKPFWWITERFVALAADLGTIDIVPELVKIAQKKGDASADRTRPVALAAIAALTGWDPRKDAKNDDEAAENALKECAL
jgi:hypothetical protein